MSGVDNEVELEPAEALTRQMQLRNAEKQLCKVTIPAKGILATGLLNVESSQAPDECQVVVMVNTLPRFGRYDGRKSAVTR